jgi:methyl acetate hydrolase
MVVASGVDQVLERAVEAGVAAGVIALAADDTGVIYEGAFGKRDISQDTPMTLDTVVWIASMSKAVTSVAAMQLVEQGRLDLDEPLSERLPELASIQVLEGFDDAGAPRLRSPRRPITLRRLLTHTAGFAYDLFNADMTRYYQHAGVPNVIECKNVTLQTPLLFDPGEAWEYGINIDWVGKTVERLSEQSLEDYFREHIFGPLGMNDTSFVLGPQQRARLAGMHTRQADGSLAPMRFEVAQQPEFFMGGGGLYGTAPDYLKFLRMLLGGGKLGDARVLLSETVDEMNRNQIGELNVGVIKSATALSHDAEFFPGMVKKWGLAYMISTEEAPTGRSPGSVCWAGLANTYFWIDPGRHVAGVFATQLFPFADPAVLDAFAAFEQAVYASRASRAR